MRTTIISTLLLGFAGVAVAQSHDRGPLDATAIVELGGFFLSTDVRVRLDGQGTVMVGDPIDFEDTFGLDGFERFRFDGQWRISDKHSIRGMYFTSERTGTRELTRDLSFGDETFPVGATTTARWELNVMQVSYDYAFKREDNYELAAGIGLHLLDANLGMEATVAGAGGAFVRELSENGSTDAPLPVLGLRGVWRLPHNLYVTALAQYFYVDFGDYAGSLSDLKATIVWQATPHFGVGLGYNDFRFKFKLDGDDFSGRLRWNYGGAMAFASIMF
jgi:hypothetical protein